MGFIRNYSSVFWLLGGIIAGSIAGLIWGSRVTVIQPVGEIFINLLFTAVVPLVFFAIADAIAQVDAGKKLGRILGVMSLVFLATLLLSAIFTMVTVTVFPIHQVITLSTPSGNIGQPGNLGEQLTRLLTVNEFYELLSRKNMLPFIIFSVITGFAAMRAGAAGQAFRNFLHSGNEVMKQILHVIMKAGPVGLGAYFACQVGTVGPQLFGTYAHSLGLYYIVGIVYLITGFTLYAFIAGGFHGIRIFWKNNIVPMLTAVGTGSSIATIPANLEAAPKMGVPNDIANVVIPLGATLHKDGSSISAIVKMAVVFGMYGKGFDNPHTILMALGITVIVSIVEGGIPNGGYVGEMLMMSIYGFPLEALPAMIIIGTLVDPLATILNATGDNVAAMMTTRFLRGSLEKPVQPAPSVID
ncbi:dicarboxylate/amino acid:cation symporter [Chitinophaga sp. Cy-1792]|uniref:dicarboxylate/amino acid:cation symporter n=1 Tax=Chitinophaga sp. Cy-1792 TaxID=2608339 RepID=UPI00142116C3|nr:dicarboxylate/amino acid:cation symporter [Chitinophaga sp. Cy-1792]NIG54592.1 dicarboxylate/amino acid:cation symporter [Chitinophaga sp. Cy-1792]